MVISRKIFFSCGWEGSSGLNLCLEAFVQGEHDVTTGLIMNLTDLKVCLQKVKDKLDHKHLNYDIAEFAQKPVTDLLLLRYCFDDLKNSLRSWPSVTLAKIRLYKGHQGEFMELEA